MKLSVRQLFIFRFTLFNVMVNRAAECRHTQINKSWQHINFESLNYMSYTVAITYKLRKLYIHVCVCVCTYTYILWLSFKNDYLNSNTNLLLSVLQHYNKKIWNTKNNTTKNAKQTLGSRLGQKPENECISMVRTTVTV